jgi:glycosyltransferase involved in cell wall biosynthesis
MAKTSSAPPSPIRLALVITELEVGGAEQAFVTLATKLARARFAPVVYSLGPRPENGLLTRKLEESQTPLHFLNVASRWQFFTALSRLAALLRKQQPHILQAFMFHANVVGALAAQRARVPAIVTGIRVADPSGWRMFLERRLTSGIDKIVCVSESVKEFCRRDCRFPAQKLMVIGNGIDLARFSGVNPLDLAELGIPPGRKAILSVGRLHRQKGLDWLIGAVMPAVFQRLPAHDLVLVGEGPQKEELLAILHKAGIESRVHFAGWRANIPEIMAACDLLVLPSRWEGMPNVLLEAMASRLPMVASRVEGVEELLGESVNDQACPFGDAAGFSERIVLMAEDRQLAERLSLENYQRTEAKYRVDAMVAAYEALYTSLTSVS